LTCTNTRNTTRSSSKYACQKSRDNFHYAEILLNKELRDNARAIFNDQTEEEFHNALYDNYADYAPLVKYVLDWLGLDNYCKRHSR
jgi:hypothetical protein